LFSTKSGGERKSFGIPNGMNTGRVGTYGLIPLNRGLGNRKPS